MRVSYLPINPTHYREESEYTKTKKSYSEERNVGQHTLELISTLQLEVRIGYSYISFFELTALLLVKVRKEG